MKLYFDMDGVVANLYESPTFLTDMFQKDYFRNIKPTTMAKVVNELALTTDVAILSAAIDTPWCANEKREWIAEYMPNVTNIIIVPIGANKADYVTDINNSILFDDYSKNLREWEEKGGIAVKVLNSINARSGKVYNITLPNNNVKNTVAFIRRMAKDE